MPNRDTGGILDFVDVGIPLRRADGTTSGSA